MVQSATFWAVLVSAAIIYWLLPSRVRSAFLAVVSFCYLALLDAFSVAALLVLGLLFYAAAPHLAPNKTRRVRVLTALLLAVCGFLGAFKYLPPLMRALTADSAIAVVLIPLGISYYCFKLIHFAIECTHGTMTRGSFADFMLYIFLFPTFTAGPIERYDHFIGEREDRLTRRSFVEGASRIVVGVIKQAVVADLLLKIVYPWVDTTEEFLGLLDEMSTAGAWIVVLRTYLYVYLSFSAYCDIAIGASRLFGLRIQENFNWPIFARNLSDFWQRWHITLSRWCQTYIYLPALARTRNPYLALQLSFFVMGMWHAGTGTRLLWGIYHAVGVSAYMTWSRLRRRRNWNFFGGPLGIFAAIALTQLYVLGSWAILSGEDHGLYQGLRVLAKLFFVSLPA